jgi:uncharacterized Tic20 family protein
MATTDEQPTTALPLPVPEREAQLWGALAHFGGIFGFLPALIIFLTVGRTAPKTRVESKEALNWQITLTIVFVILNLVVVIVADVVTAMVNAFGSPAINIVSLSLDGVMLVLWIINVVLSILGGIAVNDGGSYRYPFAFRFIK